MVSMSKAKKGKLAPSIPGYIQEVVNLCTKFCLALDGDMEAFYFLHFFWLTRNYVGTIVASLQF